MSKKYIFSILCLVCSTCLIHAEVLKLQSKNVALWIEDYKGAFQYPDGIRYKLGIDTLVANSADWHYLNLGKIEGKTLTSADFTLLHVEKIDSKDTCSLTLSLQHKWLPLKVTEHFTAYDNTGVITSQSRIENESRTTPIGMQKLPAMSVAFADDSYDYSYLSSGWGAEGRLTTSHFDGKPFSIESKSGRCATDFCPWFTLHDITHNIFYTTQLAWSSNWYLRLSDKNNELKLDLGEYFDNGHLSLLAGQSITLPQVAFSAGGGSIDEPANNLHRYQRRYILPVQKEDDPMLAQFNTWYALQINTSVNTVKPLVDVAASLGLQSFTIDSGWFVKDMYEKEVGNWTTNKDKFPNTLREIADYVRQRNMKFGIWFEIESVGSDAAILKQHPEWCLQDEGKPAVCEVWCNRRHLDFSNPEAFRWALKQFDRIYRECGGIDWVKLDYNISIGSHFTNAEGLHIGNCLRKHILAYYNWLDTLRSEYPKLIVENCSSGALRMDIGIMKHAHTSWVSDETSPLPELGMAWSSTLQYTPRMLNHWTVGMQNSLPVMDTSLPEGYWDFMFKAAMNGQFGISSCINQWPQNLLDCAQKNIDLYKKIRTVIADADCYHLSAQPDYHHPKGWMEIAYLSQTKQQAVVMAYHTNGGGNTEVVKIPHLLAGKNYKISVDGKFVGSRSGRVLAKDGFTISLGEYRAAAICLE